MRSLSLLCLILAQTWAISGANVDIPPLSGPGLGGLLGAALSPQYYGPREVEIFNPQALASQQKRKRTTGNKLVVQPSTGPAGAIYTTFNNVNYNFVAAYDIFTNGSINTTSSTYYLESYNGQNQKGARFKSTGSVYQDALDSQSSVVQGGARLFLVNAGSGTLSSFAVNCTDPKRLIALGTIPVNGASPNTVALAIENQIVCVGSTGSDAGIECFTFDAGFGTVNPPQYFSHTNVSLPLPIQQAAGIPSGPPDTLSQLLFTDDEKYLIAIVKGAANANLQVTSSGYINVYPIGSNGLGQPVQSTPQGTEFLFGCTFKYNTYTLFCADSGVGAVLLSMGSNLMFSVVTTTPAQQINPTSMNCWTARSPYSNGPFYLSAVNENYIAAFTKAGKYETTFNFTNGNPQLTEMATANNFVYGLTFGLSDSNGNTIDGPAITVARDLGLDGQFQQEQVVSLLDFDTNFEGMAVFIPSDESNICDFE